MAKKERVVRLRLPEILAELGWTQRQLAQASGLSENAISSLARQPSRIGLDTIAALCRATGKEPGDLFEFSD